MQPLTDVSRNFLQLAGHAWATASLNRHRDKVDPIMHESARVFADLQVMVRAFEPLRKAVEVLQTSASWRTHGLETEHREYCRFLDLCLDFVQWRAEKADGEQENWQHKQLLAEKQRLKNALLEHLECSPPDYFRQGGEGEGDLFTCDDLRVKQVHTLMKDLFISIAPSMALFHQALYDVANIFTTTEDMNIALDKLKNILNSLYEVIGRSPKEQNFDSNAAKPRIHEYTWPDVRKVFEAASDLIFDQSGELGSSIAHGNAFHALTDAVEELRTHAEELSREFAQVEEIVFAGIRAVQAQRMILLAYGSGEELSKIHETQSKADSCYDLFLDQIRSLHEQRARLSSAQFPSITGTMLSVITNTNIRHVPRVLSFCPENTGYAKMREICSGA